MKDNSSRQRSGNEPPPFFRHKPKPLPWWFTFIAVGIFVVWMVWDQYHEMIHY